MFMTPEYAIVSAVCGMLIVLFIIIGVVFYTKKQEKRK